MFAVSSKNTERGSRHILAVQLEDERARRTQAQRAAWQAEVALAQEKAQRLKESVERSAAMASELHAQGFRYRASYKAIEKKACDVFDLRPSEIRSNRRSRDVVFARQFVMYWSVRLTRLSLPQIGRLMGGRDHTTCLHGKRVYPQKRAKMGRFLREAR